MQDNDQRNTLKHRVGLVLLILLVIFIVAWSDFGKQTRVYDCSLADISPDFPQEVKDECLKLRLEEFNRKHELSPKYI